MKGKVSRHPPPTSSQTKFSAKGDLSVPKGESRDRGQREELEEEGKRDRNKGEGRKRARGRGKGRGICPLEGQRAVSG